jgi:hypothetical protein
MTNFFSENDPDGEVFFQAAKQAVEGLFYISETDAAIVPFVWPKANRVTSDIIIEYSDLAHETPVEERSFGEFFGRLTLNKPWHGEREEERTKKFLELQKLLEEYLTMLKVFRLGKNPIDIFVAGRLNNGSLAGVRTKAVET